MCGEMRHQLNVYCYKTFVASDTFAYMYITSQRDITFHSFKELKY